MRLKRLNNNQSEVVNTIHMQFLRRKIAKQTILLSELVRENRFLKSPLHLYNLIEAIQNNYSILLNPPPNIVKGSEDGMSEEYKISATDIICITSSAKHSKIKEIHLKKYFPNRNGVRKKSKLIKINKEKTIPAICKEIESAQVYLVSISQSDAVNVNLYELDGDYAVLKMKNCNVKYCHRIKIIKKYRADFQAKKEALERIRIFHRIDFFSILGF